MDTFDDTFELKFKNNLVVEQFEVGLRNFSKLVEAESRTVIDMPIS